MQETEKRDIITLKRQIPFIKQSMQKLGYEVKEVKRVGSNWILSMERKINNTTNRTYQKSVEEKLRLIEITTRKKCGYNELFLNLMTHTALFCIQGAVLFRMNLVQAHPKIMLEIGMLLFFLLSGICLVYKLIEVFGWNKLIKKLKRDILLETPVIEKLHTSEEHEIISVLFTRNHGFVSDVIYLVSGRQFTHASIGLGEQTDEFFSFDYRGFRTEHPGHRTIKHYSKESLCYQFKVTPQEYQKVKSVIEEYLKKQPIFKYNFVGAVFSVFHIYMPLKSSKVYFCSEFVSQQLRELSSFKLKKQALMYLPTNLSKALVQQDNLYKVLVNEV